MADEQNTQNTEEHKSGGVIAGAAAGAGVLTAAPIVGSRILKDEKRRDNLVRILDEKIAKATEAAFGKFKKANDMGSDVTLDSITDSGVLDKIKAATKEATNKLTTVRDRIANDKKGVIAAFQHGTGTTTKVAILGGAAAAAVVTAVAVKKFSNRGKKDSGGEVPSGHAGAIERERMAAAGPQSPQGRS